MNKQEYAVRNARLEEHLKIGGLMVDVYSQLEGFPKETEQPGYYQMLKNIGTLTTNPETELLIAISSEAQIAGAVVYFGDMKYYGSGGTATSESNSAGFRFLAVDPKVRRQGIGNLLIEECIRKARESHRTQMIIHSTKAMQTAWKIYLNLGFKESEDLDFLQGELPVFGFRFVY